MRIEKGGKSKRRELLARFHVWWLKGYNFDEDTIEKLILNHDACRGGLLNLGYILFLLLLLFSGSMAIAAFLCKRKAELLIGTPTAILSLLGLYWVVSRDSFMGSIDGSDNPQIGPKSLMSNEDRLELLVSREGANECGSITSEDSPASDIDTITLCSERVEETLEGEKDALGTVRSILEHPRETDNQEQKILEQVKTKNEAIVLISKNPVREDLDRLKTILGIKKGSLQFKKRGSGIYLVRYNPYREGYDWIKIGGWAVFKRLLEEF